jgi:SagB-type dehydrogenase family enzyme
MSESDDIGDRFQKETKYRRDSFQGGALDLNDMPVPYKEYPDNNVLELPTIEKFELPVQKSFNDVLRLRRSTRAFSDEPLSQGHLSYLLWASTGIQRWESGFGFRTAPSAGGLYPIETYIAVNNITHLDNGIYHYSIPKHALEELERGEFDTEITKAALGQEMCSEAAVVFIWTAIFQRSKWKYKQRAYRYIYLDAGHIAENLALAATALDLGVCQIGALFDDELNNIVGIDGIEESVIYLSVVGHPNEA